MSTQPTHIVRQVSQTKGTPQQQSGQTGHTGQTGQTGQSEYPYDNQQSTIKDQKSTVRTHEAPHVKTVTTVEKK